MLSVSVSLYYILCGQCLREVVSFVSTARYALLGSLGVDWFYCIFSRDVACGRGLILRGVRRGNRPSDH